jgi:hypothetical protein
MRWVFGKFTEICVCPIIECSISAVRNGDCPLHANAAGVHIKPELFAWASLLAMLTDIAPFFDEM